MQVFGIMRGGRPGCEVISIAVDESGHKVGGWVSSSESWAKRDLPRALPEGAEIVWVDEGDERLPAPCPGCSECEGGDDDG